MIICTCRQDSGRACGGSLQVTKSGSCIIQCGLNNLSREQANIRPTKCLLLIFKVPAVLWGGGLQVSFSLVAAALRVIPPARACLPASSVRVSDCAAALTRRARGLHATASCASVSIDEGESSTASNSGKRQRGRECRSGRKRQRCRSVMAAMMKAVC